MDVDLDVSRASPLWKEHYYREELPDNIEPMRRLLETYSKVPPGDVDAHLRNIVR